ncbi:MAG: DUF3089 domain-containing protein [Pseudohongiella sp.]|nr:DUF3089 domain-containing protein [Pseudohongiella sp.]
MNQKHSLLFTAIATSACAAILLSANSHSAEAKVDFSDSQNWLCLPDNPRACGADLNTTIVNNDGSTALQTWAAREDAPVDCFYVYPTVSLDTTPNSDMDAGPEEYNVVRSQFARLGSECRTFAPLYRQVTLTALRANMGGGAQTATPDREMPYRDVVDAWNYYLENHNDGRGVILIGHSQGAGVLSRLIINEIEGKDVQSQIISAMLLGATAQVPEGNVVGGTFKHMPVCESGDQTGCIVSYVSFRSDVPPPATSLFGRNGQGSTAICTNPAQLASGHNQLNAHLSNATVEGFASNAQSPWVAGNSSINTPFVSVPGLLTGECVNNGQFSYLEITVNADPSDPRTDTISGDVMNADGSINAGWGLHLIDVNAAMGDLVTLAGRQARAYLSKQ